MKIDEMTMVEFAEGLKLTTSVVIPFGSTEEHGPHLPLSTDTLQPTSVAIELSERRPLFVAPSVPYGVCRSSANHPGTIGISTATLRSLTIDLVESFYRQGLRCFVLLSGHAGGTHLATMIDAGEELLVRFDDLQIAVLNEFMLAGENGEGIIETPGDSHAGEIETSRLLYTHEQLVRKGSIPKAEFPGFPDRGILVRDKQAYWPGGVWGNPEKADRVKGRKLHDVLVDALDGLVGELERRFREGL